MSWNVAGLFGADDTAEQYANALRHLADRQLDAVRDTNRTSLRRQQLTLDHAERSEMRWLDYLEDYRAQWAPYQRLMLLGGLL